MSSATDRNGPSKRRERAGISAEKVSVRHGVEGGRGVVVGDVPVMPGEVVARVPIENALCVAFEDALPDSAADDFPFSQGEWVSLAYWRSADWDSKLCALLLYHRAHREESPWKQYINELPSHRTLWTAADLSEDAIHDLQYPPMMDAVECYQYRVGTEYARMRAAMPLHAQALLTRQEFEWAMKVVHSRAFSIPPGGFAASSTRTGLRNSSSCDGARPTEWPRKFALVPLLDMMNHGSGKDLATFRFDAARNVFELVAGPGGYASGNQVLVSYGDLTNDDLLLLYGFVQAGNPCDVYELEEVTEWAADDAMNREWNLYNAKIRLLEDCSLCYEGRKFFVSRTDIDPDLVAALRILLADANELRRAMAAASSSATHRLRTRRAPPQWYQPFSAENEMRVWAKIERQCGRLLAEFPTSLDIDEEMIILLAASSVPSDVSVAAPLLFRVEKKRILRDAVQMAAVKQLCIATEATAERESSLMREVTEAAPPPPETWDPAT